MIDILATYREEKNSSRVIELPNEFFDKADGILVRLKAERPETDVEAELIKQEVNSSNRALEMLSDLRIKKVLKGAIADAYRSKPEHSYDKFTTKERALYENIVSGIKGIKGQ